MKRMNNSSTQHNVRWWRWFAIVTGHLTCANRLTGKPVTSKVMTLGSNPSLRDYGNEASGSKLGANESPLIAVAGSNPVISAI